MRFPFVSILLLSTLFFGITLGPKGNMASEAEAQPIAIGLGIKYVQALLKKSAGKGLKITGKKIFGASWGFYDFLFTPLIELYPDIQKTGKAGEKGVELAMQALEKNLELRQDIENGFLRLEKSQRDIFELVMTNKTEIENLKDRMSQTEKILTLSQKIVGRDGLEMNLIPGQTIEGMGQIILGLFEPCFLPVATLYTLV